MPSIFPASGLVSPSTTVSAASSEARTTGTDGTAQTRPRTTIQTCLECPICLSVVEAPLSTPCGHTFCGPCITQHCRSPSARCPSCRKFLVGEQLYANYALESVLEVVRKNSALTDTGGMCAMCKDDNNDERIKHPISFLHAVATKSGAEKPSFVLAKENSLFRSTVRFGGAAFASEGQRTAKLACKAAARKACEHFFGASWPQTLLGKRGAGGRHPKLPVPYMSLFPSSEPAIPFAFDALPSVYALDAAEDCRFVHAANELCRQYGISTPHYQRYALPRAPFPVYVACVIDFVDQQSFISARFTTIHAAREDCAVRVLQYMTGSCGLRALPQRTSSAEIERLCALLSASDINREGNPSSSEAQRAIVEKFARFRTRIAGRR